MWQLIKATLQTASFFHQTFSTVLFCLIFMYPGFMDKPGLIPNLYILLSVILIWFVTEQKHQFNINRLPLTLTQLAFARLLRITLQQLTGWVGIIISYAIWVLSGMPPFPLLSTFFFISLTVPLANASISVCYDIRAIKSDAKTRWISYSLFGLTTLAFFVYGVLIITHAISRKYSAFMIEFKVFLTTPLVVLIIALINILFCWISLQTYSKRKTYLS